MQINWFTVIAQIINFFILVWLLKRFLYKPILKAIEERENKIASQIKEANSAKKAAKKEQEEFSKKNVDFDENKKALMDEVTSDIKDQRQNLMEEAINDAKKLSSKLEESRQSKLEKSNHIMALKTKKEVFSISRKVLTDIASVSLEEQVAHLFIKRLNDLKQDEKQNFIDAFTSNSQSILIQSAFTLPAKQKRAINTAIQKILGVETTFQFSIEPELISGIELTANGYKLGWSISEYLNSIETNISEILMDTSKLESSKKADTGIENKSETRKKKRTKKEAENKGHEV